MKTSPEQQYIDSVTRALGGYQFIEQLLKRHIEIGFTFVQYKMNNSIPFKFSGKDYESAALERLIVAFSKLSNNAGLVKTGGFKFEVQF